MNSRFMLTLTHSKFNKITMEGGYRCLLPTFRVHPVTHLLSFTLEERRKKKKKKTLHSPTEEQLPSSAVQNKSYSFCT